MLSNTCLSLSGKLQHTTQYLSSRLTTNRSFSSYSNAICRNFPNIINQAKSQSASECRLLNRCNSSARNLSASNNTRRMSSEAQEPPDVIVEKVDGKGILTLNRPKVLNSLNLSMIDKIYSALKKWETEQSMVIVKGAGEKAFCAGGDIVYLTKEETRGDPEVLDFFRREYTLNHYIGTYPIPFVAFITGIVMGGGCGLSVNGKYRVASEKSLFAMPETAIGLFPDVGGSHFLPRLRRGLGLFLALTGHRLRGNDLVKTGLATHFCPGEKVSELQSALLALPHNTNHNQVSELLDTYHYESSEFSLTPHLQAIVDCFTAPTLNEILDRLAKSPNEFCQKQVPLIESMSPTSVVLTYEQLKKGENLSLKECMTMEFRMATRVMQNNDFYEGVRARLVEKDNKPKWQPESLTKVDPAVIATYFDPLPDEQELKC